MGTRASYAPLDRNRYEAAIERYRDESVDGAVGALRSPGLRIPIAAARIVYQATGGRFGLAKDWVDLEATSVWIVVERAVKRLGGSLGEPAKPRPLEFPVAGIATAAERSELTRAVRAELLQRRLATRKIWLRFEDGERVAVSP